MLPAKLIRPGQDPVAGPDTATDEAVRSAHEIMLELQTSDYPVKREAAIWLQQNFTSLVSHLAGIANKRGHSFVAEVITSQRNKLFRQLGKTKSHILLHAELKAYQANAWLRDRLKANPYPSIDDRHLFYEILTLRDHVPSVKTIRQILK